MSNNAPDYEDNLVFPPQDDQIVGEPEGKLKGKVTPFSEQEFNEIKAKTTQVISGCVLAATYELKDQLQIKDMRISKLKQKRSEAETLSNYRKQVIEQIVEELCDPDDDCDVKLAEYFSAELIEKIKEAI